MSITPEQAQAIRRWGATTQYVSEVRLFGSQATGEAKEGSDIDIAITIGGDDPGTVRGTYFALGKRW
jgi:predicted nucleotidyltransferase